jgi:hypothetical protein
MFQIADKSLGIPCTFGGLQDGTFKQRRRFIRDALLSALAAISRRPLRHNVIPARSSRPASEQDLKR